MRTLDNQIALITGASRGIGKMIALKLASEGAKLVLSYRQQSESSADLQKQLQEMGTEYLVVLGDLSDTSTAENLIIQTRNTFGKLDILINNAALLRPNLIATMPDEDWSRTLDVNLTAPMRLIRTAIPLLVRQKKARIINIGSTASIEPFVGQGAYGVAKAGMSNLTKVLAKELARRNITVNCVAPGFIESDMSEPYKEHQNLIPLKRFGKAEEVAGLVWFLTTPEAAYITGQTLVIDGGLTI